MSTAGAPRPALGVLCMTVANLIGGASFPMQALAVEGLEPGMVAALRHVVALPLLWVWMRACGASPAGFSRGDLARVAALGVFAFGMPMLLGVVGVELASASNASVLILTEPVMILLFARFLLGERVGGARAVGVLVGLAGALCIVLETAGTAGLFRGGRFAGNAILVLSAALWGLYTPLVRSLLARRHPQAVGALTVLFSLLLLLPYGVWDARAWRPDEHLGSALAWTVALGVFVSFVTTVLWVAGVRHLEAGRVAPFVFLQPLSGVLLSAVFLGERLSPPAIAGAVLITLGCACAVLPSGRRREPPAPGGDDGLGSAARA